MPHRLVYVTVAIDETLRALLTPSPFMVTLARPLYALERRLTPVIMRALRKVGLAHFVPEPDERTMLLGQVIWKEARARDIEMHEVRLFNLPRNLFHARKKDGGTLCFEGMPLPERAYSQVWWLDNKGEMKKRFSKLGIPVARGGVAFTKRGAQKLFQSLSAPVIVKPYSGSGSRHTTLHIRNEEELMHAFAVAKQVAPLAVIEEELYGNVYRATVVDGKCVAVLRRDQPRVIGTGVHAIVELIEKENTHPARSGPYFSKITLNDDALLELAYRSLTPESVLPEGEVAYLHQKINWSVGGTTADVTDTVHQENMKLFERVAQVLRAPVVGIDFIIPDITRAWQEQERLGVIECNSMPFLDNHHLPFEGEPRNVAGAVWDMTLS